MHGLRSSDQTGQWSNIKCDNYYAFVCKVPGTNCIKIGLPGKLILSQRKGLWEVLFS